MKISMYMALTALTIGLGACQEMKTKEHRTQHATPPVSSDLAVDHLNIWVNDPVKARERLAAIGFTAVPDSMSAIHSGQGSAGKYFNFLNAYLELIFVHDRDELIANNEKNQDLDFVARANYQENGASPFSIALRIKDYDIGKIPFETIAYHQDWMEEGASIYAAKSSKTHLHEPSVFVVYPEIEALRFDSIADLEQSPSEDDFWKAFFKHPNGAQHLTRISITSPDLVQGTSTLRAVNAMANISVKQGDEHLMELIFDEGVQEKSFDLRPDLPLIVYL